MNEKEYYMNNIYPNLNRETALKDLDNLIKLKSSQIINTNSYKGSMFVNYFTLYNRLQTIGNKQISFLDFIRDISNYQDKQYIKNMLNYYIETKSKKNEMQILYRIFCLYFGSINIFKPTNAMNIYKRYNPTTILDPTMGWGGRLVGACALDIPNYIGIDSNIDLKEPYDDMVSMLKEKCNTNIKLYFEDSLKIDYSKLDYDMVFTSPPYYNIEQYRHQPKMTKEEWNNNFYKPLFKLTWEHLKSNGYYCINVSKSIYETILINMLGEAHELIPLSKEKRTENQTYKEYIYVWKKI